MERSLPFLDDIHEYFNGIMKEPSIAFEDNHLLVIEKPAGWLVQSDRTGDRTLTDWGRQYIREKYKKPGEAFLHPAHRLDRPVSGLIIFCRTSKALERITKMFRDDDISKTYLTVTTGRPSTEKETLVHWLEKDAHKNFVHAYVKAKGKAKRSELSYELVYRENDSSMLVVQLKTGRSHQIRTQLSKIDCPIKGDLKYGSKKATKDKSILLHSYLLEFVHPVKKEFMRLKCPPQGQEWFQFQQVLNELD